jgi:hypothetical protein
VTIYWGCFGFNAVQKSVCHSIAFFDRRNRHSSRHCAGCYLELRISGRGCER